MDKRYKPLSLPQQLALRQQAIDDILNHPEWPLNEAISHLKRTLRLTTSELAKLAKVSPRTLQEIELGKSPGTVKSMNSLLGVVGLRLGVVQSVKSF